MHQLGPLLRKLHMHHTSKRHLSFMSSYLLCSILSFEHLIFKHLLHAQCFPHYIADVKNLCFRKKSVCTVISRNERTIQDQSYAVVLLQMDLLGIMRRILKHLYPPFIHGMNSNFFNILRGIWEHVWVQNVIKALVNIRINGL